MGDWFFGGGGLHSQHESCLRDKEALAWRGFVFPCVVVRVAEHSHAC